MRTLIILILVLIPNLSFAAYSAKIIQSNDFSARIKAQEINLNSATTDHLIPIPSALSKYIVRRVTITNSSIDLSLSLATVGVFTSTGGGGTTIVTLGTVTGLTTSAKYIDFTIAASDTLTSSTIYVRIGVAHGSAATADVYIDLQAIP